MALTQIVTTDSVSASVVNTKIVDPANTALTGLQIAQTAGGTATAITLTGIELTNGYQKTFIISASNSGSATTINGKPLYKPGGTVAPNLVAGKSASIWYNLAGDCFFYKASAEGTAVAGDVLATKTFSNDSDTGLTGTLALSGTAVAGDILATKTAYNTNPKTQVTGTMPNRGAVTITPSTAQQAIAAGYHNGSGYVAGDADLVAGNIKNGVNIFGVTGAMVPIIEPGDNTLFYLANTVAISSTTPYKMKEVKLDKAGIYRVSFQLWHDYGETYGRWAYAQIYINRSPVGTTRSSGLTSATTFTEDITVKANDLLQIYLWCNIDSQGFPRLSQMYVKVLNLQSGTINMN